MKRFKYILTIIALVTVQLACITSLGEDETFVDSDLDVFSGSASALMDQYSDDWHPFPFQVQKISYEILESEPAQHQLKVEVSYGGGEGCPANLFVLQWDGQVLEPQPGQPQINLGLARFLNSNASCEALVTETLIYDLRDLIGDQIDELNTPEFNITNLTTVTTNTDF